MQSSLKPRRATLGVIGPCALLALSIGLSGCYLKVEEGENIADQYGEFAGFCGILQDCGSDSDNNRGGSQTATGSSSSDSSSSSTSGGTGGESATSAGGE
jgi:hypothetical protein